MRSFPIRPIVPAMFAAALWLWVPSVGGRADVAANVGEPGGQRVDDPAASLAPGRILLATRQVRDSIFEQSVVLLIARSETGTAGLMVNRPTDVPVARVLPDMPGGAAGSRAFFGGPVSLGEVRGLARLAVAPAGATPLLPGLHLLSTPERVAAAIADGVMAGQMRLYYGYAGWGAGQLEREIGRGDWYVLDGDAAVVFDAEPTTIWHRRIRLTDTIAA